MKRYEPDWILLSEARARLKSRGFTDSEAETDITLALSDGKFRLSCKIEAVATFSGEPVHRLSPPLLSLKRQGRLQLSVPRDLAPDDLDWENSSSRKPWPYSGFLAHFSELRLRTKDFDKVFGPNTSGASETRLGPSPNAPVVAPSPATKPKIDEETRATRALVMELKTRKMSAADARQFLSNEGYSLATTQRPFARVLKNARSQANAPAKVGRPPKSSH
jgi:hypothetical protein